MPLILGYGNFTHVFSPEYARRLDDHILQIEAEELAFVRRLVSKQRGPCVRAGIGAADSSARPERLADSMDRVRQ